MTRVLLVGVKPEAVDYSDPALPPGMSAEKIHAGIELALKLMTDRGWQADVCLIQPDATAGPAVERRLGAIAGPAAIGMTKGAPALPSGAPFYFLDARGRDHRRPVRDGVGEFGMGRRRGDARAVIMLAPAHHRPTVVAPRLRDVELVASKSLSGSCDDSGHWQLHRRLPLMTLN